MQWIQYLLFALILWFFVSRMLPVKGLENLSAANVKEKLKNKKDHEFIDVREIHEYRGGHIRGFKNIPLSQLPKRLHEIDRSKQVVLTCRSGARSRQAAKILKKNGFTRLGHLKTGISGWDGGVSH